MLTFLHPHFSHLEKNIPDAEIVRFEKFSDGWPRIFLTDKENLRGEKVTYIGDFRYVEDFFGQLAFLDGLSRYHIDTLHIHIPFFPAASMERDTPSGELSIANVFARTLGLVGERNAGRVHIHLYDIHDEREVFYFPPSLQIHHHTTTDILKREVLQWEKPIILFPDAGAKKAFSRFFEDYEVVTCAKVRKSPTEIEMYFEGGNLEGREVIIVDDHIRTGGTLIEAARYAREKWARAVFAFAPHGVFAEGVKTVFLEAFDRFYTTDTIPMNIERFAGNEKVEVLNFWSS
jgi:ribose-phosphate pyrophosphokinase